MAKASHIESWTTNEVADFLSSLDLSDYSDGFLGLCIQDKFVNKQENEITGDILVHLDHESLKEIGVESVGHRLLLLRAIYDAKIADDVPIEPEHFIPASVEAGARPTSNLKDTTAMTEALQQRDERIALADAEITRLNEALNKLKEQLIPVFKIVKEFQPLPTPDPVNTREGSLSRKFSTKKLFLGSTPRQPSPTTLPSAEYYTEPVSPSSPYKYDSTPQRTQTPLTSHSIPSITESTTTTTTSSSSSSLRIPPPRPPPPGTLSSRGRDRSDEGQSNASLDAFKSFRVGFDDPCSKVLPAALKKYKINSDWRDYSLFICYGDQERSLGLDEKPLLVFQDLQKSHKNPVFMLRLRKPETHDEERF